MAVNTLGKAATVVLTALLLVSVSAPAVADLRFETEITYTAEVEQGALRLDSSIALANLTPDQRDGDRVIQFFYDSIQLYVPETVENMIVTAGGAELGFDLAPSGVPETEGFLLADIDLGRRLYFGDRMTVNVAYDIPGDPPRSNTPFRINPAYISFGVVGWGDPGRVTVRVVTPAQFDLTLEGSHWDAEESDGITTTFTISGIEDPSRFFIHVRGFNDDALTADTLEFDGFDIVIRSWPDDQIWNELVTDVVETGLPELQRLTGLPWRTEKPLQIVESAVVTFAGYGGWYLADQTLIEIGEWAEPFLVLHELSHSWFNHDLFLGRWINEGLANEYAARATVSSGLGSDEEVTADEPEIRNPDVGPLNDWVIPTQIADGDEDLDVDEYEMYGYSASQWVIHQLLEEIGTEAMTGVFRTARADEIAYRGDVAPEIVESGDDWRRFLDLVEEIGGSISATDLFEEYVTDLDLNERSKARERFQGLEDQAGDWGLPFYVRGEMSDWGFDEATARMAETRAILDLRHQIESNLTTLGLEPSGSLENLFETATGSLEEVQSLGTTQLETSGDVVDASEAMESERNLLIEVGLLGVDIDAEYAQATEALGAERYDQASVEAAEVVDLLEQAEGLGLQRLSIGLGAIVVVGAVWFLVIRRRRSKLPGDETDPVSLS